MRLVEEYTAGPLLVYLLFVYFLYTICILVEFYQLWHDTLAVYQCVPVCTSVYLCVQTVSLSQSVNCLEFHSKSFVGK